MTFVMPDFMPVVPEMFLLGMTSLILVVDLFLKDKQRYVTYLLSQVTLVITLVLGWATHSGGAVLTFGDTVMVDDMAVLLKSVIYVITFIVFLYARPYLAARDMYRGEYFVLGLFGVLGMMVMVSSYSFLILYLGLELLSLSLYAMVALRRDSRTAAEAAMKYFILGAIASGMLLYGMSILYGLSGTLNIIELSQYLIQNMDGSMNVALAFALAFVVVALAFKMGAVPFHMWLPDVYQGAPTAVTLYLSAAPKIAGFALIMRLLVEGLGGLHADWQDMLSLLAVLSIALGNVIAIAQSNLKRMLAYSTISHVGFIFLGILAGTLEGYASAMFYSIVYAIMSTGTFGMIILLSREGHEAEDITDFKGLGKRSPWLAFIMLLLMFSMAGVPPLIGFHAKLAVLQAVVNVEMTWLAIFAVAFSVIGAFYYLRVIKVMYFDAPEDDAEINTPLDINLVMGANGLMMLGLGFMPGLLMTACVAAISW